MFIHKPIIGCSRQLSPSLGTTTWNPSDKSTGITLSGGNLTAANDTDFEAVRATTGTATGKYYFEIRIGPTNSAAGICKGSVSLTDFVGHLSGSMGQTRSTTPAWWQESVNQASPGNSANDIFGFAIDFSPRSIWIAVNNTWYSSGNPSTGTNPIATAFSAGTYYPVCSPYNGDCTGRFKLSDFSYAPPNGFAAWGS